MPRYPATGRVALITGAAVGIGLETARALHARGACLVLTDLDDANTKQAAASIGAERTMGLAADVTDRAALEKAVAATVERFGRLDIVVANAGGPPAGRALEVSDAQIEAAVNSNLLSSVRLVREAVPHMRPRVWGRICLITSSSIKQPIATLSLSNTARTGLWAWAKTAAADLFAEGITLNLACPGLHNTDRMKQLTTLEGPRGDPADFGKVVAFLCSEPARFVSGAALTVDGAATTALS